MKRFRTIISILFISLLPLSFALGQEKKNEQKVKIIIADKSGTKVAIDTIYSGDNNIDTIILKGGNMIYIGKDGSKTDNIPGRQVKVIAYVDKDGVNTGHKYIYINDDKVISHSGDEKFDIFVSDDEFDKDLEKTQYIFAKDGITVTMEGNDEEKVKELAIEIEKKLDIDKEVSGTATKEVIKKTIKK
ncbi:MAG: hypothetical protein E4H43_00900 [Bacteroidia bacterium]|nr:MAG: hypothetical protein E4H43_00900 [Bacteroidia bacterium]